MQTACALLAQEAWLQATPELKALCRKLEESTVMVTKDPQMVKQHREARTQFLNHIRYPQTPGLLLGSPVTDSWGAYAAGHAQWPQLAISPAGPRLAQALTDLWKTNYIPCLKDESGCTWYYMTPAIADEPFDGFLIYLGQVWHKMVQRESSLFQLREKPLADATGSLIRVAELKWPSLSEVRRTD